MVRTAEALVNAPLLRWAREDAGYTVDDVARRLGVRQERIAGWEEAVARPSLAQARRLAALFKRPLAFFYLPSPPPTHSFVADFRRPDPRGGEQSPQLRVEIRRARERREIALRLLEDLGEEPTTFALEGRSEERPDQLGRRIRAVLGVNQATQSDWARSTSPFAGWRAAAEHAGAIVVQMSSVAVSEARGFSLGEHPLPVVAVNIKDSTTGRVFSLLHEIAHLALRETGVCDFLSRAHADSKLLRVEQFCNAAAGAALLPEHEILGFATVRGHRGDNWSDSDLRLIARAFGASREAVLRRLLDLGLTTADFYADRRQAFLAEYERTRREGEGFAPPHLMALATGGPRFTGLVLAGYAAGHATASDVADYLGVRIKHVSAIERQLAKAG